MTILHTSSRAVLFGLAALAILLGLASLGAFGPGGGGLILVLIGGGAIIVLLFERIRYRSAASEGSGDPVGPGGGEPPGELEARFEPTDEVFVDPSSSRRMRVHVDRGSGERRYVAED